MRAILLAPAATAFGRAEVGPPRQALSSVEVANTPPNLRRANHLQTTRAWRSEPLQPDKLKIEIRKKRRRENRKLRKPREPPLTTLFAGFCEQP